MKKENKIRLDEEAEEKINRQIIVDRDTGEKLEEFHNIVEEHINEINKKFNLNCYEMIGVLEAIIFTLHDDALNQN